MSLALLKYFTKKNWMIWAGVTAFMLFEVLVCIFLMEMIVELTAQMGITTADTPDGRPNGAFALKYVAELYPMMACLFPMVFFIMMAHKLLSKPVDNSSISTFLSAGIKRTTYVATAAVFMAIAMVAMFTVLFVVCGLAMLMWGSINRGAWLMVNFTFFMVNLAVAFICFALSSIFAATKQGLALTVAVPVLMMIFQMLSGFAEGFKYLTLYGWIDVSKIIAGTFDLWWLYTLVFIAIAIASAVVSIHVFNKKQLSI